jgi:ParB family transcriptional regulator, chromosome partitioning protein
MATKLKGLGRGLDALLMPEPTKTDVPANGMTLIEIAELQAGKFQPRRRFDDASLAELSASIKAQGIMQPIVVRKLSTGKHEIIAGERRFRAARLAGLTEVPVIVKDVDDRTALTLALIENLQRQDLNAIEEALGLQRLIAEFSFTHEQAADAVGKSRSAVSNLLRLLELAAPVQDRVIAGTLEMGHARALAPLPKDKQVMLAENIAINGLSVRATEALVKAESAPEKRPGVPTHRSKQEKLGLVMPRDADLDRLETELADTLGTYVEITHQANGQGELVIRYASLDQLDGLITRMKR